MFYVLRLTPVRHHYQDDHPAVLLMSKNTGNTVTSYIMTSQLNGWLQVELSRQQSFYQLLHPAFFSSIKVLAAAVNLRWESNSFGSADICSDNFLSRAKIFRLTESECLAAADSRTLNNLTLRQCDVTSVEEKHMSRLRTLISAFSFFITAVFMFQQGWARFWTRGFWTQV